jgi:hypothetical protein
MVDDLGKNPFAVMERCKAMDQKAKVSVGIKLDARQMHIVDERRSRQQLCTLHYIQYNQRAYGGTWVPTAGVMSDWSCITDDRKPSKVRFWLRLYDGGNTLMMRPPA